MGCVFCEIAAGRIPAARLYESETVLAFLDAFPLARGHCLVIPKAHRERIQDMPPELCAEVFGIVRRLAARADSITGATLVAVHNGRDSGQEIPHVHVHIIPRSPGDGAGAVHSMFPGPISVDGADMDRLQAELRL